MMKYFCCDERRRSAVTQHSSLNGIDFLEVLDDPALPKDQRQRTLFVHFIKNLVGTLTTENVRIQGGERIRSVVLTDVNLDSPDVLRVEVVKPGDFSIYRLRLVRGTDDERPPQEFDPLLSVIDFSFKVACSSDFDCQTERFCPSVPMPKPEIDYLAKDYASFRRLMLDRLATLMPDWQERSFADLGVALVELLAYVGDYLSYQQDAVATEAYLGTARRRISVRRHARLVDYTMHDGCNARVWVQVRVTADGVQLEKGTPLFTGVLGRSVVRVPRGSSTYDQACIRQPEVFETIHKARLFQGHNEMSFYTWGSRECCLPKGATRATLNGQFPNLKAGDVLVFAEVCGPQTGEPEDADRSRRHAARLTHVALSEDPLGGRFLEPPNDDPVGVTEIQWATGDALPFPLCISARTDDKNGREYVEGVSIALGNIVLADHGRTIEEPESLGSVPQPRLFQVPAQSQDHCQPRQREPIPPRFHPRLQEKPLTFATPYEEKRRFGMEFTPERQNDLDNQVFSPALQQEFAAQGIGFRNHTLSIQGSTDEWSISDGTQAFRIRREGARLNVYELLESARKIMERTARKALSAITLESQDDSGGDPSTWLPRRDLLNSRPTAREFVAEIESDGAAVLRFGDDEFGQRPPPGTAFRAFYRIENGVSGNIGAETLIHIVSDDSGIERIWNPLPACGGVDPESIEHVRQSAPYAFRSQERAVTPEDYAAIAGRHPQVQRAAATMRWTGSWHTVFVTVDRFGGAEVDEAFRKELKRLLDRYRMAGQDVEIDSPRYVPLEIEMKVCVEPDHFRDHVKAALLERFSSRTLPDGERGVFHPDIFTFGQPVHLSQLYAVAEKMEGVASVRITEFQRQGTPSREALDEGKLKLGRLEIARLDNDPNFPEHGVFRLIVEGGK